ncbi:MAG: ABC transporter permease [Candidatus Aminicenantes bacterium]|nr:ABC transporter permease [Candidatus Aminicenantes bacterium]
MFDLEHAITEWKKAMRRSPSIEDGDVEELERYLRDKVDDLAAQGLSPQDAFRSAESEFRRAGTLDAAYSHVRSTHPGRRFPWRPVRFSPDLLWSYVKIALRRLRLQKTYSLINIGGMALGLACTLMIFIWVRDELGFDRFHTKADRVYRVILSTSDDGSPTNANGSYGLGPALKKDFPEVLESVRIKKMEQNPKRYVGYQDRKFYEPRFFFAEPSLFTVFDFPLVRGDAATALRDPNSIVLTEDMAKKYFGDDDPVGKVLEADPYNDGKLMLFRVTGVAMNVPRQSHFHFDFLASYGSLREDSTRLSGIYQHYTYVLLKDKSSAASLAPRLLDFLKRNWQEDPWYTISFQPLRAIHLRSGLRSEIEPTGNILDIYVFSAIALAVLLIACINFMNLATARSAKRAKEVGIRKAVGAPRSQLVRQFLGESLSTSAISTGGAFLLIASALPWFNRLTGKGLAPSSLADPALLLTAAVVALVVGIVSGIYPAFFLSAFEPVQALKSRAGHTAAGAALRRALVVFQFVLSIGIICSTLIIRDQMTYIRSRDLGFDRGQILVIPLNGEIRRNYEGFRSELLKSPGVENTATSAFVPTGGSSHSPMNFEGGGQGLTQVVYFVDKEFLATYGIELVAGRTVERPASKDGPWELLISEQSAREAGCASPQDAVGKRVDIAEEQGGQVVGVVNDINLYSLHTPAYPIVYIVTPVARHNYLSVRIKTRNVTETLAYIQKTWRAMVPSYPLDVMFLDASFEQLHISEQRMSEMFSVFSVLAIAVACLGLFGLAAYTAEQKTKEIGVRKILGASAASIYVLLSREFLRWVALANVIAWPLAYFAMSTWLRNFAFRVGIGWGIFVVSAAAALAIAALTVGFQTLRAARSNPVDSLRYE